MMIWNKIQQLLCNAFHPFVVYLLNIRDYVVSNGCESTCFDVEGRMSGVTEQLHNKNQIGWRDSNMRAPGCKEAAVSLNRDHYNRLTSFSWPCMKHRLFHGEQIWINNPTQVTRWALEVLTGNCHLKGHLSKLGLTNSLMCKGV
jgi:hypothetical protein